LARLTGDEHQRLWCRQPGIGDVDEVLVDPQGKIRGSVAGVGNLLGVVRSIGQGRPSGHPSKQAKMREAKASKWKYILIS
jgi:hypothetical protein